jgi:hypothetical protein
MRQKSQSQSVRFSATKRIFNYSGGLRSKP